MSESLLPLVVPQDAYEMNIEPVRANPRERRVTVTFYTYSGRAYKYRGEVTESWEDAATRDKHFHLVVRDDSFLSEEPVR